MPGWKRAALLPLVLALALAGCSGGHHATPAGSAPPRSAAPSPPSAWQTLLTKQIKPDGTVDKTTALQAFALAIGPLPGVTPPAGPAGDIFSGTLAIGWLRHHWSELTAEQRQAADQVLAGQPSGHRFAGSAPPATPTDMNLGCPAAGTTENASAASYRAQLDPQIAAIAQGLGRQLRGSTLVMVDATQNPKAATAWMYALTCAGSSKYHGCVIHITPRGQHDVSGPDIPALLAHEAAHCFMDEVIDSDPPAWLTEGAPTWIAAELVPASAKIGEMWANYLTTMGASLFERTYTAIGYYMHLAESGIDPWKHIDAMWKAGASGDNTAAWKAAGPTTAFLDSWPSSFARGRFPGQAWDTTGPTVPSTKPDLGAPLLIHNGTADQPIGVNAAASQLAQLTVEADVVTFTSTPGAHGRLGFGQSTDVLLNAAAGPTYCTKPGGCSCPQGTSHAGTSFVTLPAGPAFVAVTGGLQFAKVDVHGQSLEDFCKSASCIVGNWRTANATFHFAQLDGTATGGGGIRIKIAPSGHADVDYATMKTITYTAKENSAGYLRFDGTQQAQVTLPPPGVTSGPWHANSTGTDKMTFTMALTSPVPIVLIDHLSPAEAAAKLGAGGSVGGTSPLSAESFSCTGGSLTLNVTLSTGDSAVWTLVPQ